MNLGPGGRYYQASSHILNFQKAEIFSPYLKKFAYLFTHCLTLFNLQRYLSYEIY